MAQIYKRSGKWSVRIQWKDTEGKRFSKSKAGFATKALAKKWAAEMETNLNRGIHIEKKIAFSDYYEEWVNTYKQPKISSVTLNRYIIIGNLINDYFKETSIKEINRSKYQEFINKYGATHAIASVKKLNSIIRSCVQSAILDDYLLKDFTKGVTLAANTNKTMKVEYPNVAEIRKLLTTTINGITNRRYTSRYMIVTAIYTGMRKEEIQALTWNDIDFIHHTINIDKAQREVKGRDETDEHFNTHRFKPTKNESSTRKIKVNEKLLLLLKQLRNNSSSNLVFMDQFNTIPTSTALNKTLRQIMSDTKLSKKNFHFHSLRHSHVALLLSNGIDIYAISKRLGHNDITTTMNTYAYLIDEYKSKTDDKIVQALSQF